MIFILNLGGRFENSVESMISKIFTNPTKQNFYFLTFPSSNIIIIIIHFPCIYPPLTDIKPNIHSRNNCRFHNHPLYYHQFFPIHSRTEDAFFKQQLESARYEEVIWKSNDCNKFLKL